MDTVLIAIMVVRLPRVPVCISCLCVGVLPDVPALLGSVTQADPVELAVGQEAIEGYL